MTNLFGRKFCLWVLCPVALSAGFAEAQIRVASPVERSVFQRGQNDRGRVLVDGTVSFPYDKVEGRLVAMNDFFLLDPPWESLSLSGRQGTFHGSLEARGGWHRLELRGLEGGEVRDTVSVAPVGIGEVFLVAGHSNAMGLPLLGARDGSDFVVSFDRLNKYLNPDNITVAPDGPMPAPRFGRLTAEKRLFPSGESAWYWGELGTLLGQRLQVPVLFMNAGWAAANSFNWRESAEGRNTRNIYIGKDWPNRQPYANMINTLKYYHTSLGLRSILWFHGENDAIHLKISQSDYYQNIRRLIERTNQDFGRAIQWVVAQCSVTFNSTGPYAPVLDAQSQLAGTPGLRVWRGPYTDTIQVPRPAHGHFENKNNGTQGLSQVAQAWNRSLSDDFFARAPTHTASGTLATGVVPKSASPGQSFLVPFTHEGVGFSATEVHLLDEAGEFVEVVGAGRGSPVRVQLPASLPPANYRLRVMAKGADRTGSVSEVLRVERGRPAPDFVRTVLASARDGRTDLHALMAPHPDLARVVVERGRDRTNFRAIGEINLAADRGQSALYTYRDAQAPAQTAYYRLRLENRNGSTDFSPLVAAFGSDAPPVLTAFPNPAAAGQPLYVRTDFNPPYDIRLTDVAGRPVGIEISTDEVVGLSVLRLPAFLPPGLYLLRTSKGDEAVRLQRIVVR